MVSDELINKYIDHWFKMDVGRVVINCPYYANKIRNGKVVLSGFKGGKGDFCDINNELNKIVAANPSISGKKDIFKLARRNRIGIDCSGFVFRLLAELIRLKYQNCEVTNLEQVFPNGIYRTNADELTRGEHISGVKLITHSRLGDLIRMNKGHHVAMVIENEKNEITYIHSSNVTIETGVHLGKIMVNDQNQTLVWRETTKNNINFGDKYYHPQNGDGIYRLKIFNS
ncbi:hypothetical protein HY338_01340 [Candidatus Gottesmanbacteria bacterium]|nr:hypothetical protein [Candidatus Gottesmanbacteria bacterium]